MSDEPLKWYHVRAGFAWASLGSLGLGVSFGIAEHAPFLAALFGFMGGIGTAVSVFIEREKRAREDIAEAWNIARTAQDLGFKAHADLILYKALERQQIVGPHMAPRDMPTKFDD